ncbi:MAG: diguanylate cyclase [Desulfovibrionaceae bacterium]
MTHVFDAVVGDLIFLAQDNELQLLFAANNQGQSLAAIGALQREYIVLAKAKAVYDQIRYIDEKGMERVRVNFNAGNPVAVPHDALQDKSARYYFSQAMALQQGDVYLSPFDLNVENERIEMPHKPMIRFSTPAVDGNGGKHGVVVLNYLAQQLLDRIMEIGKSTDSEKMLVNADGHWLLHPDPGQAWGFMFPDRAGMTFGATYPEEWRGIMERKEGQMQTKNGVFTFSTIYPIEEGMRNSLAASGSGHERTAPSPEIVCEKKAAYSWVLVSRVPPAVLAAKTASLETDVALFGGAILAFSAIATWMLALALVRRRMAQAQLVTMAQFDLLTGLPNRALFHDRLDVALREAERHGYKVGLLYIDLDGFKKVNDTMGHHAGDEILVKVSRILEACTRKSDTAARLGGDEFAAILVQIASVEDAQQVGDKIVTSLNVPFELAAGTARIGASIGAAVFPDHATDSRTLVSLGDKAMYAAKNQGKNVCVLASP